MIGSDRDCRGDRKSAVTQFPSVEGLSYGPKGLDHTYGDVLVGNELARVERSVNKSNQASSLVRFRSSASLSIKAINIRPQGIYGLATAIRTA